jgi:hypothetical protein
MTVTLDLPEGWSDLRLPPAVAARLQALLDRQDAGDALTAAEREEAGELVDLAETLTLLRLRRERGGP